MGIPRRVTANVLWYYSFVGKDLLQDSDFFQYQRYLRDLFKTRAVVISDRGEKIYLRDSPPNYNEYFSKVLWSMDTWFYKKIEKQTRVPSISMKRVYAIVERNIRIVSALSKSFNFELVYYLQPTVFSTRHPLASYEQNPYGNAEIRYPDEEEQIQEKVMGFAKYNAKIYAIFRKRLPELSRKLGFTYSDSDEAIAAEKRNVFIDSVHFGDRGNRLIALHLFQVLETVLLKRGLLPSAESARPYHRSEN